MAMIGDSVASTFIVACCGTGFAWALKLYNDTMSIEPTIDMNLKTEPQDDHPLTGDHDSDDEKGETPEHIQSHMKTVSEAIQEGAQGFLVAEYKYVAVFMVMMSATLLLFLGSRSKENAFIDAIFTTTAFLVGGVTSLASGYLGMSVAVVGNVRTTATAYNHPGKYEQPFAAAFKAGGVMGFSLCAMACIVLFILIVLFKLHFDTSDILVSKEMYECIAGYGLGGSSVALFGRVGGGIYTKAADVGADIFKLEGLKEDDPRNPAVIADNVGDNVGDIAGMGADLFGSFAESSCAAMLISASSPDLFNNFPAMCFPLLVASAGIIVCLITSLFATECCLVKKKEDIEESLKRQLILSTVLMTPTMLLVAYVCFPPSFTLVAASEYAEAVVSTNWDIFFCVGMGLWSGLIIGLSTEHYTSAAAPPTQELALKSKGQGGAPTNIIYGLALGYKSVIVPICCLAATVFVCFTLASMYGVACGAIGILSTLAIGMTIDAYGPVCDNAGGIAEMSGMAKKVRDVTDDLDAAGNTTAAIGKGFAIGSAAMVGLALFGAFVSTFVSSNGPQTVDILQPWVFAGLLIGAMLPYWFSAMTMKSVGEAASDMAAEVERQFTTLQLLSNPNAVPEYKKCVEISTNASLQEMIPPGALVIVTPLIVGYTFGVQCLAGMLVGSLTSGVQLAISASNSGGAWDNAKKYVESKKDEHGKSYKNTAWHQACVTGDTVGDPMKDTSGPSLNILIKLTAITSLVFAPSMATNWDDVALVQQWLGF